MTSLKLQGTKKILFALFFCTSYLCADPVSTHCIALLNGISSPSLLQRLRENENIYSTAYALFHPKGKALPQEAQIQLMKNFETLLYEPELEKKIELLQAWVQSPVHAVYVVENIDKFGSLSAELLSHLLAHHEYFKDALPVKKGKEGVLTLAFDIEDPGEGFSMLYRPSHYTDEQWLELPHSKRISELYQYERTLVPTGLKPDYLGRPSFEGPQMLEVKHRKFELEKKKLKEELTEVFQIKKNTHSAHVHLVSEFPNKYEYLLNFVSWRQQRAHFVDYKGLEEGLFSDTYTGIYTTYSSLDKKVPDTFTWLNVHNKFSGLGLRAGDYGRASGYSRIKVGIELRDLTRDPKQLNQYIDAFTEDLQNRPWETREQIVSPLQNKYDAKKNAAVLIEAGFPPTSTHLFDRIPFSLIEPDFSKEHFYDYDTHTWKTATPEALKRIAEARKNLLNRLKNTAEEYKKHPLEADAVAYALKLDLVDWAKEARVSELFPENSRFSLPR